MSVDSPGGSRLSKNNCQEESDRPDTSDLAIAPADMGEGALRAVSVRGEADLRDEARMVDRQGELRPVHMVDELGADETPQARPWYKVVSAFRQWYGGYLNSHIEFVDENGEVSRTRLENSYQPGYGDRYYARLMDLKRAVERRWDGLTPVMLTFSASTLNANGDPRAPGDHMREIAGGFDTARKQLHQVLKGYNWEYAKVWEATTEDGHGPAGYGHMHVAVFVEDGDDLAAKDFAPVMRSYVSNTTAAGWEAHRPEGDGVSIVGELEEANLATYISEYIGSYGKETLNRSMHEQAFLAVSWATRTRRVEFSEGAQELIAGEKFRRETGLRPEDRGRARETADGGGESDESDEESEHMAGVRIDPESETIGRVGDESDESDEGGEGWVADSICNVSGGEPDYYDTSDGGVAGGPVEAAPEQDPPRDMGDPPPGPGAGVDVPAVVWSFERLAGVRDG